MPARDPTQWTCPHAPTSLGNRRKRPLIITSFETIITSRYTRRAHGSTLQYHPTMSWLFGWLPGIPSINLALPSSIQGRFVSFVLKKLLGNFVKPGQLDIHQIDSQVGSGFVQVNDLELESSVSA